ncbi:MAG: hypothetical protein SH820_12150 [Xanthomonadales bacterium]|nr:hypothetical protein [Xanthomonadales bacterium]
MFSRIPGRDRFKQALPIILVAAVTFWMGLSAYTWERERGVKPSFYQSYYEPAVRMACGQPFGVDPSGKLTDEMKRFLRTEVQTLTCESVTPVANLDSHPSTRVWYHLFATTAQIWKFTGISWPALDGLAAGLLAISAVMVFALFRLLMPVTVAFALTIVSILPALRFLPYLRDMNKAPFILAALFVIAWLVLRTPTRLRLCGAMAALGLWLGIGYGFRPDVLIVLPLLIATILFFRPLPLKSGLLDGMLALPILLGSFVLAASPVLSAFVNANVGSCQWHFGLLGLSDIHTGMLGLTSANYSWLNHYDDLVVWRSVESYAERAFSLPGVGYCTSLYDQVSKALYLEIFRTFPADFMLRGLASAQQVIGHDFWNIPWLEMPLSWGAFFADHRAFFHRSLLLGWVALGLFALAWNVRIGLFLILAVAFLSAYPAIQFDFRHFFHLSFLAWLPVGIISGWIARLSISTSSRGNEFARETSIRLPTPAAWIRGAAILVGICAIAYGAYSWARHEQTVSVQRLFGQYLEASGTEAVLTARPTPGGGVVLATSAPKYPGANKIHGHMLRLDIGGPGCSSGTKKMSAGLGRPDNPNYYFKKELVFDFGPAREHATVFFPAYFQQGALSDFSLVLPREDAGCIRHAAWLRSDELPSLWVQAILYPDWRQARLYQWK